LIGHRVSVASAVALGLGVTRAARGSEPVHDASTPPANAIAEVVRNALRERGSWTSRSPIRSICVSDGVIAHDPINGVAERYPRGARSGTSPHMVHRSVRLALAAGSLALLLAACDDGGEVVDRAPEPVITAVDPSVTPSDDVAPPPEPRPEPPSRGPASDDCVEGWTTPRRGDPLYRHPLGVLRRETGWRGPFVVHDLRYFRGPESPPDPDKGYLRVVERWYLKGYQRRDPALQGRFLIERRVFGSGLSAVAPYGTHGWRSPDWIGFQLDTFDPEPKAYPGLPGDWSGIPYDFVRGGEDLTFPGLPEDVVGCLSDS
jgi:hypothetical protein